MKAILLEKHIGAPSLRKILVITFCFIMQWSSGGSGEFIAKRKSCVFDPSRFRWFPISVYRRNYHYDPNYGYEIYWEDGKWVLETTTKGPTVEEMACDEACHEMFVEYGPVCGRGRNYTHKTFQNYCQLLNEDCSGREKWMIAYRGNCQKELKTRPTKQADLIPRADKYIRDFERANPATVQKGRHHHLLVTTATTKKAAAFIVRASGMRIFN